MQLERRLNVSMEMQTQEEAKRAAYLTGGIGAVFAILFLVSLYLLRSPPGAGAPDQDFIDFYNSDERRKMVLAGLYILPLSAVAFIWFIAALRQWIAHSHRRGSQMIGTVQLVSGFGFITLTLTSAAASILPAAMVELTDEGIDADFARDFPLYGNALLMVFGVRMAAIFVMTTTNIGRASGVMPKWFVVMSVAIAAVLFLSYSLTVWLIVVFPLWVLAVGILMIREARRRFEGDALVEDQSEDESTGFLVEHS